MHHLRKTENYHGKKTLELFRKSFRTLSPPSEFTHNISQIETEGKYLSLHLK